MATHAHVHLSSTTEISTQSGPRQISVVTNGRRHGPVTRLISPSAIGNLIKPFVYLDYVEVPPTPSPLFGMHPHSGIATLTTILEGEMRYEDTTGQSGVIATGGVEWMKAGKGVWHEGAPVGKQTLKGFQLWIALPPEAELSAAESQYIAAESVPTHGPVRVILGHYKNAVSPIRAPSGMNYYHVRLKRNESWRYTPPLGHNVAWLAVNGGRLLAPQPIAAGSLAVFEDSYNAIEVQADEDTSFVFGSAIKHLHPLVLGYYSVHTNHDALARGEAEIDRIGLSLRKPDPISSIAS